MKKFLSGFCLLALVTTFAAACTDAGDRRTGEGPDRTPPAASPRTTPPAADATRPPATPPADSTTGSGTTQTPPRTQR